MPKKPLTDRQKLTAWKKILKNAVHIKEGIVFMVINMRLGQRIDGAFLKGGDEVTSMLCKCVPTKLEGESPTRAEERKKFCRKNAGSCESVSMSGFLGSPCECGS